MKLDTCKPRATAHHQRSSAVLLPPADVLTVSWRMTNPPQPACCHNMLGPVLLLLRSAHNCLQTWLQV
jgi:hypothetical protein